MKKLLTVALAILIHSNAAKSQCSVNFAPTQDCTLGDEIAAFMFAGVGSANSSGCSPAGYGNYTLTTFNAQLGSVVSWSSTTNGYYYGQGFAVWIDLNNNSIYESTEQVVSSAPSNVHTGTLAIPFNAVTGVNLRMRVRCAADASIGNNEACTNNLGFGYGETEEYRVLFACPSPTAAIPSPTVVFSNQLNPVVCPGNSISLIALGLGTYTWSGGISNGVGFTPTITSSYTVIAALAGCPSATSSAVQGVTVSSATPTLSTNNSTLCGSGTATLTASSNAVVNWYATPTSTALLGSGSTFTAFAASTTTYYAAALTLGRLFSQTFTHTGAAQTFVIPAGTNSVQIETWGAEGGGSSLSSNSSSGLGGKGGYARGVLNVIPGSTLNIFVGGHGLSSTTGTALGGFNGGGQGHASSSFEPGNGGGGASDVRYLGIGLADRVIVAGGGGGGGEDSGDQFGHGGGLTGVGYASFDASQTVAGAGGGLGFGGGTGNGDGGGGGGGFYGGGTFSSTTIGTDTQGGGGGSGFVGGVTGSTLLIAGNASMPNPIGSGSITGNSGHGYVRITVQEICQISARVPAIVNVSGVPTVAVNSGSVCSGSSFTITPSGANTYTIQGGSNIVSPTANTTYTVIGSNTAGCVSANSATSSVTVNASPTITVNSGAICVGQTFTISPSGATTYTVQGGSNTVSPTANTSYTVIGSNAAGCVSAIAATSTVTVNANPTITVNSGAICVGQTFTISPSGANTYTVQGGSNTVSPSSTTSYSVTGTSADGCLSSSAAVSNVTVNPNPTVTASSNATIVCAGESATITANGANTYTWNGGTNSTSLVVSPTISTSYTVTGSNASNCSAKVVITQSVSECSGIDGLEQEQLFSLYPNPNAGEFTIVSKGDVKLTLINELGQNVQTIILNESNEHKIQLTDIANGIYFITGINNDQVVKQKIIVSK